MIENNVLRLKVTVNEAEATELFQSSNNLKKNIIELAVIAVFLKIHPHVHLVLGDIENYSILCKPSFVYPGDMLKLLVFCFLKNLEFVIELLAQHKI